MAARGATRCGSATMTSPDRAAGKAIPYGVYDLAANAGFVNVGTDHDTAAFAAESIRRWWDGRGQADYPGAPAAAGHRRRRRVQRLPHPGLEGRAGRARGRRPGWRSPCCHFPPGTSKWNKIEHRLFCHITLNWRGRPLTSYEVIVNTHRRHHHQHRADRHAVLDTGRYPAGAKVSDAADGRLTGRRPPRLPRRVAPARCRIAPVGCPPAVTPLAPRFTAASASAGEWGVGAPAPDRRGRGAPDPG